MMGSEIKARTDAREMLVWDNMMFRVFGPGGPPAACSSCGCPTTCEQVWEVVPRLCYHCLGVMTEEQAIGG